MDFMKNCYIIQEETSMRKHGGENYGGTFRLYSCQTQSGLPCEWKAEFLEATLFLISEMYAT